jgi:hypothetical protein
MRKLLVAAVALLLARGAEACDICAVYTAMEAKEAKPGLFAGVFEQWSDFGTLRLDGDRVDNDSGEDLRSSITQVYVGYQLNHRFGVQVTAPHVDRSFRRVEGDETARGSESGLGDVAVMGTARLYESLSETTLVTWSAAAGLKLPTGRSDRLGEEAEEDTADDDRVTLPAVALPLPHQGHGAATGVHSHDLALGSGSTDGLFGTSFAWRHRRWFGAAAAQYALRRRGDFDYRYADEVTWEAQAGGFVFLRHEDSLSLALRLSGEKKGEDSAGGERADDTAIDAIYAGPQAAFSRNRSLYAEAALELPVRQRNSGLQLVPDLRVRGGLTWRF